MLQNMQQGNTQVSSSKTNNEKYASSSWHATGVRSLFVRLQISPPCEFLSLLHFACVQSKREEKKERLEG